MRSKSISVARLPIMSWYWLMVVSGGSTRAGSRDIVETGDGNIFRDAQPGLAGSHQRAQGHHVVGGEHCAGPGRIIQQLAHALVTTLLVVLPAADEDFFQGDLMLAQAPGSIQHAGAAGRGILLACDHANAVIAATRSGD